MPSLTQKEIDSVLKDRGLRVDMNYNEMMSFLSEAEHRMGEWWYGPVVEIKHNGIWKHICRTTLWDDVCTNRPIQTIEAWMAHAAGSYGARIDDERFAIIDSMTDG